MTIATADNYILTLEYAAEHFIPYDIDNDSTYIRACEIVTRADMEKRELKGKELKEFMQAIEAVQDTMIKIKLAAKRKQWRNVSKI